MSASATLSAAGVFSVTEADAGARIGEAVLRVRTTTKGSLVTSGRQSALPL